MTKAAAKDIEPLVPSCFAFSAKEHVFACLGHDPIFNISDIEADDQVTNGIELGDTAWAFRSPDNNWLAVSIVGLDGGEDTAEFSLDTAVIDVATSCVKRTGVVFTTRSTRS